VRRVYLDLIGLPPSPEEAAEFLNDTAPNAYEKLVERLNGYLGRMTDVIFEHQGTLDKFIGDAIMAFWGAPLQDDEHALHAVRCSMAMHRAVDALREEWKRDGKNEISFEARIGLNTGQVIVGNIGSEKHLNYTVIGDNVNLASRLEGLTRLYEVPTLIGEVTEERVRSRFVCRLVENQVLVKGKAKRVKLFEPLCPIEDPMAEKLKVFAARFAEALQLYGEGKFEWARKLLVELQQTRPQDGPSRLYLERCDKLIATPPKNWDGTYVAHSK
jgi:adenylate cyclase